MFKLPQSHLATWNPKPASHGTCLRGFMLWGRQTVSLALRLRSHSQNNTIAASAQADRKISGRRSNLMATLRQSLVRPNIFSIL